jgi:transposase-like protein
MLEAEMDEHFGYNKHSIAGSNSGNKRDSYMRAQLSYMKPL